MRVLHVATRIYGCICVLLYVEGTCSTPKSSRSGTGTTAVLEYSYIVPGTMYYTVLAVAS